MGSSDNLKPRAISGFPEWLPQQQSHEDAFIETIKTIFASYGFLHLETSAVELNEVLCAKGVDNKEIYTLNRIQAEENEKSKFSLHFDLTVPFARYVALNQGQLNFPFKRYQIQKVWRGERPAQGRFREFYQCDIDIVGIEQLPIHYEAELIEVMSKVFHLLNIGKVIFKLNNRKILQGFYESLGINGDLFQKVLIEVDKIDKIGKDVLSTQLKNLELEDNTIESILSFAQAECFKDDFEATIQNFNLENTLFKEGVEELKKVFSFIGQQDSIEIKWQGSITRGLNYYTGCIFETELVEAPELGSICSGGRYENLCGRFSKTKLPGVGISLGLTRLLSHLFTNNEQYQKNAAPVTDILLTPFDDEQFLYLKNECANSLRDKGFKVEIFPPAKLKKVMNYANKKGIPYVIIPNEDKSLELKNMETGEQEKLSPEDLLKKLEQS